MTQTAAATERLPLRDRLSRERGRVWVVGHRGAMGHCPENTLASFERGLQLGADWIELDVHLSRDNALIVIHDETLDRTTNGKGAVRDHSLAELKALDAGSWFGPQYAGERIPTLDEVLRWARQRNAIVDIEIKNAPVYYAGIEAAVVEALDRYGMTEQVIVISFEASGCPQRAFTKSRNCFGRASNHLRYVAMGISVTPPACISRSSSPGAHNSIFRPVRSS